MSEDIYTVAHESISTLIIKYFHVYIVCMCYVKHFHKYNYNSQDSPLLMKLQNVLNNIYT